ncbi:Cell division protein FtsB [Jatrophihabitans endophyticus]|uniref:Cell division protein FtsB n=1 Tax=Jatrophihabitans endophyticus TaxID=1206085 RepID=A0A1M5SND7_9ACTN|nr:septum formation initiator family protein [Jatrophihabitans endophyticus]SHH40079.1 Cell division protein FtsB [Jatrophihabitans endophyticus]
MPAASPRRARPVLTGRALGLGVLVVLLVVVLASPVHRYLASRTDVGNAASRLHEDRHELARLSRDKQRYADPGYIQQQARERLQYAMPGDTVYVVVDKGGRTEIEKTRRTPTDSSVEGPAWNDRLMNSVRAASR